MRVNHSIDLRVQEITLDKLMELQIEFSIPGSAVVKQNEDDYDLGISWYDE